MDSRSSPNIITSNGAFIVYHRIIDDRLHVFVQLSASRNPNLWELPGGGLDYGIHKTLLDTVIDESGQEIGYKPKGHDCKLIGVMQQLCKNDKAPGMVIVGMVVLYSCPATFEPSDLTYEPEEVSDGKWVPIEEAIRMGQAMQLGARRMLAILHNGYHLTHIHTGDLSKPITAKNLRDLDGTFSDYTV